MENKSTNIPIWKLLFALQTMLEEGYSLVDIKFEDDKTISMRPSKEEEEDSERPDLNRLIA